VRSGVEAAGMDWVLLTDADLQFDLRELEDFLPSAARADLVVGWRILRQDPVNRRLNAAAWNWLVRRMFHLPVRDVDCAFKLVRRDLLQSCALTSGGAMISTELLVKCLAAGVLADYGHATGVDLSPLAVEAARHRGHPDVRRGAIENLPFADDSFDAVTCLDVIEHTADDRASLAELRRVTRPGGLALVTVPAYQSLWSAHDEVNLHFRRYGRGQLEAAAEATGWSWVRGTHFNAMLLAPAAVVRRATRGRARGTQRSDLDLTPAFADRLLELPMAAEARWLRGGRRLACGLSMLAVLRCPVVAPASAPRRGAPLTRRSSTHRHLTTAA